MNNKITIELIPDFSLPPRTYCVCGDLHHPEIMHSLFMVDLDVKIANVIEWYKTINPDYVVVSRVSHLVGHYNNYKFIDHFKELFALAVAKYPQSELLSKLNGFPNTLPFPVDCEFFSNMFFREVGVSGDHPDHFVCVDGARPNGRFERDIVSCMMDADPQALFNVLTYELTNEIKANGKGGNND